jgi:hypothetical protein
MVARLKPKELGGDPYDGWDMLLNAILHVEPYLGLRYVGRGYVGWFRSDRLVCLWKMYAGVAWLS